MKLRILAAFVAVSMVVYGGASHVRADDLDPGGGGCYCPSGQGYGWGETQPISGGDPYWQWCYGGGYGWGC
jgi:hypothetical protein